MVLLVTNILIDVALLTIQEKARYVLKIWNKLIDGWIGLGKNSKRLVT